MVFVFSEGLLVFVENRFIVKTSRGIAWSGGLLLGTTVVGFYTGKSQLKMIISFLGGPMDVLEVCNRKRSVFKRKCNLEIYEELRASV